MLVSYNRDALLYGVDYILQPTAFIRREAWKTVGPLDERLRYCMDYDLWLRLGTIAHVGIASGGLARAGRRVSEDPLSGREDRSCGENANGQRRALASPD